MSKVCGGDLSGRMRSVRRDEFGQLSDGFDLMLDRIVALMKQNEQILLAQKQTELMALQQQVNPHFIFNALSLLIGLTSENRGESVIETCENIGSLLRYSLGYERRAHLCEELDYTRAYLEVAKLRFEGMFEYEITVDPAIEDCHVLKMIVQPIVENAVMHGFTEQHCRGSLSVCCTKPGDGESICIVVADQGAGMPPETLARLREQLARTDAAQMLETSGNHIGLQNVWHRLWLAYGAAARITIDGAPGVGTVVTLTFPIRPEEE